MIPNFEFDATLQSGRKDEQNGYVEHEPRWVSNAEALLASATLLHGSEAKGNTKSVVWVTLTCELNLAVHRHGYALMQK